MNGHVNREQVPLVKVQLEDIRTKVREYRAPVTLILVLDVSESMKPWLPIVADAIQMINQDAYRKRDRVGLIAFKNDVAHIINHPTNNVNIVAGNIKRLGSSGYTPLADGLLKALEIIKQEKRKNREVLPMVVLISDCEANISLSKLSNEILEAGQASKDAIHVAHLFAQSHVPVIIMNPSHIKEESDPIYGGGTALATEIAQITNARYYGFTPPLGWLFSLNKFPSFFLDPKSIENLLLDAKNDASFLRTGESPITTIF
jgi:Mg-chelatase subunit ChlD